MKYLLLLLLMAGCGESHSQIVYVDSINDPRLKAYRDSLKHYVDHTFEEMKLYRELCKTTTFEQYLAIRNRINKTYKTISVSSEPTSGEKYKIIFYKIYKTNIFERWVEAYCAISYPPKIKVLYVPKPITNAAEPIAKNVVKEKVKKKKTTVYVRILKDGSMRVDSSTSYTQVIEQ